MLLDRRIFKNIDWTLIIITSIIMAVGLLNLYSATYRSNEEEISKTFTSQITWMILGYIIMFGFISFEMGGFLVGV